MTEYHINDGGNKPMCEESRYDVRKSTSKSIVDNDSLAMSCIRSVPDDYICPDCLREGMVEVIGVWDD